MMDTDSIKALNALIACLFQKLGVDNLSITDELIEAELGLIVVTRDAPNRFWTFKLKERE